MSGWRAMTWKAYDKDNKLLGEVIAQDPVTAWRLCREKFPTVASIVNQEIHQ